MLKTMVRYRLMRCENLSKLSFFFIDPASVLHFYKMELHLTAILKRIDDFSKICEIYLVYVYCDCFFCKKIKYYQLHILDFKREKLDSI